jgi:hypothetical protein
MGWVDAGQSFDVLNGLDHVVLNEEDSIVLHHKFLSFRIYEKLNKSGRFSSANGLLQVLPESTLNILVHVFWPLATESKFLRQILRDEEILLRVAVVFLKRRHPF